MGSTLYLQTSRGVFREEDVRIGRNAKVSSGTVIGARTAIGSGASVERSVLGRDCAVGKDAKVIHSFLWDGVEIEDGAVVQDAIVCHGAKVKAGAVVPRGCVISSGCIVGAKVSLSPFTRITLKAPVASDDDDWSSAGSGSKSPEHEVAEDEADVVGPDGKGRRWIMGIEGEEDSDSDDEGGESLVVAKESLIRQVKAAAKLQSHPSMASPSEAKYPEMYPEEHGKATPTVDAKAEELGSDAKVASFGWRFSEALRVLEKSQTRVADNLLSSLLRQASPFPVLQLRVCVQSALIRSRKLPQAWAQRS